jgi:hypothetical protein
MWGETEWNERMRVEWMSWESGMNESESKMDAEWERERERVWNDRLYVKSLKWM